MRHSRRLQGTFIRRIVGQMLGSRNGSYARVDFQEKKFYRAVKVRGTTVAQCEVHGSHDVHDKAARATFLPADRVAERIRVMVGMRGPFKGMPGSNKILGRVAERFSLSVIGDVVIGTRVSRSVAHSIPGAPTGEGTVF